MINHLDLTCWWPASHVLVTCTGKYYLSLTCVSHVVTCTEKHVSYNTAQMVVGNICNQMLAFYTLWRWRKRGTFLWGSQQVSVPTECYRHGSLSFSFNMARNTWGTPGNLHSFYYLPCNWSRLKDFCGWKPVSKCLPVHSLYKCGSKCIISMVIGTKVHIYKPCTLFIYHAHYLYIMLIIARFKQYICELANEWTVLCITEQIVFDVFSCRYNCRTSILCV